MKCPYCNAENDAGAGRCSSCGSSLSQNSGVPEAAKAVTTTGLMIGKKARLARINEVVDPKAIISDRAYNITIVAVLLWGLLINYLLCRLVGTAIFTINPIVLLVGYLVLAISGILISAKSHNPLISFLGYNLVVIPFGLIITLMVENYGGLDSEVVTQAFLYTLLISTAMMACVMIAPGFFSKIGGALSMVLIGMVICEIVLLILGVKQVWIDWVVAAMFTLYIGYDIYRSQQYPKTLDNAVDSALDIYMDIANLFIRILSIMGKRDD